MAVALLIVLSLLFKAILAVETGCQSCLTNNTPDRCPQPKGGCSPDWINFRIYDRNHRTSGQFVAVTESWNNLTQAGYDRRHSTAVLIHGYADSSDLYSLVNIKDELLKSEDMFVILMDWSKVVPDGCYITSVINVHYAGRCLADLVNAMGRPESGLHVIGFSLGGHVPGSAADFLAPYKIPRITGLDPALPLFWGLFSHRRLKKDDGQFVDVVHTNAFIQGYMLPMGHADFYINGGVFQLGCGHSLKDIVKCSHERAPVYYAESINTKLGFWGCKTIYIHIEEQCEQKDVNQLMGYHVELNLRGIVALKTASKSPFALGKTDVDNLYRNDSLPNVFNRVYR